MLMFVASMAAVGLAAIESLQVRVDQPYYEQKLEAARLAGRAMEVIKQERLARGHWIDPDFDPTESGMVGELITPTTSIAGGLQSKQTSVNPNFAAVVVDMLTRAGVREGDTVAVGYSGSYPAINTSVCAALEAMQLEPIIIASAASSQFGANIPDFLWVDMERLLYDGGVLSFRSVAASIGGYGDMGLGMADEDRELLVAGIRRNDLPMVHTESFVQGIEERRRIYRETANGAAIKAYINVGGGTLSVGKSLGKKLYRPGLNLVAPPNADSIDSVMARFIGEGVPVIHLANITTIARDYGLPHSPDRFPALGEGPVYYQYVYNRWLVGGLLCVILLSLRFLVLRDADDGFLKSTFKFYHSGVTAPDARVSE
jgi:poly-gamma-glutamate system protein